MDRDKVLTNCRPEVPSATYTAETSAAERLQNAAIRPIIKFQNDFLTLLMKNYLIKNNPLFYDLSLASKQKYLTEVLRKDTVLRNIIIGSILGYLTANEMSSYLSQESEIRSRIIKMISVRLADSL